MIKAIRKRRMTRFVIIILFALPTAAFAVTDSHSNRSLSRPERVADEDHRPYGDRRRHRRLPDCTPEQMKSGDTEFCFPVWPAPGGSSSATGTAEKKPACTAEQIEAGETDSCDTGSGAPFKTGIATIDDIMAKELMGVSIFYITVGILCVVLVGGGAFCFVSSKKKKAAEEEARKQKEAAMMVTGGTSPGPGMVPQGFPGEQQPPPQGFPGEQPPPYPPIVMHPQMMDNGMQPQMQMMSNGAIQSMNHNGIQPPIVPGQSQPYQGYSSGICGNNVAVDGYIPQRSYREASDHLSISYSSGGADSQDYSDNDRGRLQSWLPPGRYPPIHLPLKKNSSFRSANPRMTTNSSSRARYSEPNQPRRYSSSSLNMMRSSRLDSDRSPYGHRNYHNDYHHQQRLVGATRDFRIS